MLEGDVCATWDTTVIGMTGIQKVALIIYASLLAVCVGLIVGAEFLGPTVRSSLLPVATEGFKLVLAALIGATSTLLGSASNAPR
jgi:hypothetical protein